MDGAFGSGGAERGFLAPITGICRSHAVGGAAVSRTRTASAERVVPIVLPEVRIRRAEQRGCCGGWSSRLRQGGVMLPNWSRRNLARIPSRSTTDSIISARRAWAKSWKRRPNPLEATTESTGSDGPIQWSCRPIRRKRRPNPVDATTEPSGFDGRIQWIYRRMQWIRRPDPVDSTARSNRCTARSSGFDGPIQSIYRRMQWKRWPIPVDSTAESTRSAADQTLPPDKLQRLRRSSSVRGAPRFANSPGG